jgi:hypothetical protein
MALILLSGCLSQTGLVDGMTQTKSSYAPALSGGDYSAYYDDEYVTKESYIELRVQEGSLESRYEEMTDLLEDEGAKLSNVRYNEYSDRKQYTVTAKVEPRRFDSINEKLQDIGEVKDLSVILEDVTVQYVELDVKVKSREVELTRLYELYNKSDEIEDLLAVEKEITRVTSELEILKQQQQRLISRVELSTISITIYEEKPSTEQLTNPLEDLGGLFFGALAAAITILVALAGFLLPMALIVALLWFIYKKLKGKKRPRARQSRHDRIPPPR